MKTNEITNCINVTRNAGFAADSSMATDQLAALQQRITKLEEALTNTANELEAVVTSEFETPANRYPGKKVVSVIAARALLEEKE